MQPITSLEALQALYGTPKPTSTVKEIGYLTPAYKRFIERAPFVALATVGPEGLDCSPRGDRGQAVRIVDDKTLMLPDRRGNDRIDSLSNIVRDPRISLMFLVPASNSVMRVNGKAIVTADDALRQSFEMEGKLPRTVIAVTVEAAYFQCARALMRAQVWETQSWGDPKTLPTPGQMLAEVSQGQIGGDRYDSEWPERAKKSLW